VTAHPVKYSEESRHLARKITGGQGWASMTMIPLMWILGVVVAVAVDIILIGLAIKIFCLACLFFH
jgi:hypothetical protein